MTVYRYRTVPSKHALLGSFWCGIGPGVPFYCPPVFPFYPLCAFPWVFFCHLSPEHMEHMRVACAELLLCCDRLIIQRPTVNDWVETANEFLLGHPLTLL